MGSYYADVIVDITHEKLDRTFQYRIPQRLLHQVCVGSQVEIPFGSGNRQIRGYGLEPGRKRVMPPRKPRRSCLWIPVCLRWNRV